MVTWNVKLVNVVLFFDIISVIRNKIYLFFFCLQYDMHHKSSFTPKVVYWKTWRELGVQPFFLRQAIMQQRIKGSVTKCLPLEIRLEFLSILSMPWKARHAQLCYCTSDFAMSFKPRRFWFAYIYVSTGLTACPTWDHSLVSPGLCKCWRLYDPRWKINITVLIFTVNILQTVAYSLLYIQLNPEKFRIDHKKT